MATYGSGQSLGLTLSASGDQDSTQYKFVQFAETAGQFLIATGASAPAPIGVLQNDPQSGAAGNIQTHGITRLWCDAATAIGLHDFVTSGSDGAAIVSATASDAYYGVAMEAISSGCELISVLLKNGIVVADNTP